jgi:acyl-CoA dehydrogenase
MPLERRIFTEEHLMFREAFEKFLDAEVVPHYEQWEKDKCVSREVWLKAGANGFLCPAVEEKYGGLNADFFYSAIMIEAAANRRVVGFSLPLHNDIVCPYLTRFANEEQKARWLPGAVSGEKILAIAMTEPQAGSDLAGIRTTAVRVGDDYIINGQKTFITNGQLCDLCVVAVKTDPRVEPGHKGISLIVVEDGMPGFRKGANLDKIGQHASDTSELWFEDCRVPAANLLGQENRGFYMLMENLQQERLVSAIRSTAEAEWTVAETLKYVKERKAFGQPLSKLQNIQFKLAEAATQVEITRTFIDRLLVDHVAGREIVTETMMAKWWATDMNFRIANECLQMFGGYGYMTEYPISRAFVDFRVEMIYAGSNEIMKTIIAKRMGM